MNVTAGRSGNNDRRIAGVLGNVDERREREHEKTEEKIDCTADLVGRELLRNNGSREDVDRRSRRAKAMMAKLHLPFDAGADAGRFRPDTPATRADLRAHLARTIQRPAATSITLAFRPRRVREPTLSCYATSRVRWVERTGACSCTFLQAPDNEPQAACHVPVRQALDQTSRLPALS